MTRKKTSKKLGTRIPNAAKNASALEKADVAAAQAVAPHQDSVPVRILSFAGKLGDQPPMRVISGGVLAFGMIRRDPRMIRAGFRMLAAHTLATLAKDVVKKRIDRTRPKLLADEGAGALAVAAAFARDYPRHRAAAYGAGTVIALAQVPRHAHYPTDVGAGIMLGLASNALVGFAMRKAGLDEDRR
jgi:membrane-associated phospholipid phosphatase